MNYSQKFANLGCLGERVLEFKMKKATFWGQRVLPSFLYPECLPLQEKFASERPSLLTHPEEQLQEKNFRMRSRR